MVALFGDDSKCVGLPVVVAAVYVCNASGEKVTRFSVQNPMKYFLHLYVYKLKTNLLLLLLLLLVSMVHRFAAFIYAARFLNYWRRR